MAIFCFGVGRKTFASAILRPFVIRQRDALKEEQAGKVLLGIVRLDFIKGIRERSQDGVLALRPVLLLNSFERRSVVGGVKVGGTRLCAVTVRDEEGLNLLVRDERDRHRVGSSS